jgi:F-type H+-transporting ATPase subunit delta
VASRYAGSLLELAQEAGAVDAVETDLGSFETMLAQSTELRRLVDSPAFTGDEQFSAISALMDKAKFNPLTANFMKVVARNRRLFAVPGMIKAYRAMLAEHRGLVTADVTTASELSAAQEKELKATLKEVAGKDVDVNITVDPSILGGLIVKMGSRMIDTSLKTKLSSLKLALKEVS